MTHDDASLRLLRHGLIVFLLGLVSGLAMLGPADTFKNPRLALSSHVIGVSGGMFLAVVGLMLHRVRLSSGAIAAVFWLAAYGAYGNWGGSLLAGIFGTQTMTVVASQGLTDTSAAWQGALVGFILTTSGTCSLIAAAMLLVGLKADKRG